ncbi:MAG: TetR/AcrR family transcriptional regulator [Chloroflexi bacterium]|nr:MAG: TetR/AcrR family transcriptional regulator [Chloroflexota bacterium]
MSPKPDVSAERKQQILTAAMHVFARQGIEATRMQEIAKEAGLSIGGVYWYYKSKEEIVFGLLQSFIERDLDLSRSILHAPGSARQRLELILAEGLSETVQLMPLTLEVYRQSIHDAAVRAFLQTFMSSYQSMFAELLAQGIANGEFRAIDPAAAATMLIALYEGTLELSLLDPESSHVAAMFASNLTLFFDGLKNWPPDAAVN